VLIAFYFVGWMWSVLSSSASIWQMRSFSSTSIRFFLKIKFFPLIHGLYGLPLGQNQQLTSESAVAELRQFLY
jgi:hypothetical protein